MPSGSHESGGSHFGGGFSGGGHHSSNTSSSGRVYTPGPRVVVFGGRRVYLSTGRASAANVLLGLLFTAIFIVCICAIGWFTSAGDVKTIAADYQTYQDMIAYAKAHPEFKTTAKVTGYNRYENTNKYCIFYTIETADGELNKGNSYYVYTSEQVQNLKADEFVELAIDMPNTRITLETDSIPLDYKNTTLQDDAEYQAKQSEIKIWRVVTILVGAACVGMAIALVMVYATAKKASAEQIATAEKQKAEAAKTTWKCNYCGAVNDVSRTKCEACGARRD